MEDVIKLVSGTILTGIMYLFGGWDLAIQTLIISMIVDYVSGLVRSGIQGKLNSSDGLTGILKKVGYLVIVATAVIVDTMTINNGLIRSFVIYYFIANECLSILENLGEAGVPIPKKLKSAILAFQKENNKK